MFFTGYEYDGDTGLNYAGSRYYEAKIGRFISQDPAFWDFSHAEVQLVDPQSWNSYAYARNNPLANVDTDGQFWDTLIDVATTTYDSVRYGERMMTAAAGAVNIGIGTAMNNQRIIAAGDRQLSQGVQGMNALKADIAMDAAGSALPFVPIAGLKAVKNADITGKAVSNIPAGFKLGEKIPGFGKVIENTAGNITGFYRPGAPLPYHGLDRAIERGVTPEMLLNTVNNPLITIQQGKYNTYRLSRDAAVVLDNTGKVVTTYSSKEFAPKVTSLINKLTK